jgi:hypothetical protein
VTDPEEHLSGRLAGLASGPVPRLSAAHQVRARGEQRRRRGRAALAGTGAAVLLVVGAGTWGLSERDTREGLQVADPEAPEERPEPGRSREAGAYDVSAALLTPEEAAQAEPESWRAADEQPEPGPLLDPCDERTFPRAQDVLASDEGALTWRRQETGAVVRQEVFRYRSAEAAQQAFDEYADQVQRCPFLPWPDDPNGSGTRFEVVDIAQDGGGAQLLVRETSCNPACIAHFRSYAGVARQADALTVLTYGQMQDSDPQQESDAILQVAERVLAETVAGG